MLLLAPVMAAVAIAVKFDSRGPVLFRQKRYGFNIELIEVFKFRSMYTDMCDAAASKPVTKEDPRVTPVGRFIRKTSIDELPQLFNVLLGDLSLVGPRPNALAAKAGDELYNDVVKCRFKRHKVKPGITGWAQINRSRGKTDTREKIKKRFEFDLYYIENWSILYEFYILLKTPLALLKAENSYSSVLGSAGNRICLTGGVTREPGGETARRTRFGRAGERTGVQVFFGPIAASNWSVLDKGQIALSPCPLWICMRFFAFGGKSKTCWRPGTTECNLRL